MSARGAAADSPSAQLTRLVAQVQKADYEGDRPALQRLFGELAPFADDPATASLVRYWRGFAVWRRALNGFNDSPPAADLRADLDQAVTQFDSALEKDPDFVDAKVAEVSCLMTLVFLSRDDATKTQSYLARAVPLFKQAQAQAPENPRLLWVLGGNQWYRATNGLGGSVQTALDTYQKGLALSRTQKPAGPLDPSWGEPELLMSLAWSYLHASPPDHGAAERFAQSALALVPNWHYIRDILLPQIREAKAKHEAKEKP